MPLRRIAHTGNIMTKYEGSHMLDMQTFIEKIKGAHLMRKYEKTNNAVVSGIVGAAIGDAIGVPVEFQYREQLSRRPVAGMQGHGTHNQPAGTWSDDLICGLALSSTYNSTLNVLRLLF